MSIKKIRIEIQQMNIYIFFESNFVRVNRLFVLVQINEDNNAKRFKTQKYYLQMEKTYMTKQLILIWTYLKKLENLQQYKVKIILLDVC